MRPICELDSTGDVLIWRGGDRRKTPDLRLTPGEALSIAQQLAPLVGVAAATKARNLRVGDVVDIAAAVFGKRKAAP